MHADSPTPPVQMRAGATVLSLIAGPLSVPILRAHLDGPLRLSDLRERVGGAAQTTLRGQVGNLRGIGALTRRERGGMPYMVENELTAAGRDILTVADVIETWLGRAPQGAIPLGSEPAKGAIRALVGGWDSAILRGLAARPLSLTELSSVIGQHSYPALERRLSAMRAARQVEQGQGSERGSKPYVVSTWTREAVGPLVAAGRCECLHLADRTESLSRIDIEAAFLLAVPLVSLEAARSGSALLAVDTGGSRRPELTSRLAGVLVEVDCGEVVSCSSKLEREPKTWALGTVPAWVDAILDGELGGLRIGGEDTGPAEQLIDAMHATLPVSAYTDGDP